jgi:hypothetical protein
MISPFTARMHYENRKYRGGVKHRELKNQTSTAPYDYSEILEGTPKPCRGHQDAYGWRFML